MCNFRIHPVLNFDRSTTSVVKEPNLIAMYSALHPKKNKLQGKKNNGGSSILLMLQSIQL